MLKLRYDASVLETSIKKIIKDAVFEPEAKLRGPRHCVVKCKLIYLSKITTKVTR